MIIPKLLILLPIILIAEGQNDAQRSWSNRLPLRRPVITPGFRPESTLNSITNEPVTTKEIPEFVTQQYVQPSSNNYEELTTKVAEIVSDPSLTSETQASNNGKVGFTIIFSNSYTESPITTSSIPPQPSPTQRPFQRPHWSRPINRPQYNQPSSSNFAPSDSTDELSFSTAEPSTLIVAPLSSTVFPYTSTGTPSTTETESSTLTSASLTSTVSPSTFTNENVEVAANIPLANQEIGGRKPGFTIIFNDNYTNKPMPINPSPVLGDAPSISTDADNEITAKTPPANRESEDERLGYTIIFSDNYTKRPTTFNSSLVSVAAPSISTLDVTNAQVAANNPPPIQETEKKNLGYTIIYAETSSKNPTTIVSPPVSVVTSQPIQNPAQTDATSEAPMSTVNENIVSYIPMETTNLPQKKPTESYSIIIVNNKNSDPDVSSQQIANPPKEPSDNTNAQSQNTATTEVDPVTNRVVIPTSTAIYTSDISRPIPIRPFPPRPIPFRPTTSIPTASTPLIVVVPSKAPPRVTNAPVTTPAWRTTTSTTTQKPPTAWTISTISNPSTTRNLPTQSGSEQKPSQTNVNQLQDYICRDVNGYYSLENKCDEYILCKNYIAYKNTCPDGLHFNPVARYPAYPCAYPTEVKCGNLATKQPAKPTDQCPHRFGHFPVPNGDCGYFMMCQEGVATIMPCPPGLAFNAKISACDWSVNVPGCNPSAFEGFICPVAKSDTYGNSLIVNYGYKNSCKKYIACHEGHPRLLSCDIGLSFDEATGKCVESSLVQNCSS